MRILIAEDESVSRLVLVSYLEKWEHEVIPCVDGTTAWQALQHEDAPRLVLLNWMMPGMEGPEICRKFRQTPVPSSPTLS